VKIIFFHSCPKSFLSNIKFSPQSRQDRKEEIVFDLVACLREAASAKAGERPPNQKSSAFQACLWKWNFWRIGLSPILQKYPSLSASFATPR
jgi:hypothetical protein